MSPAGLDRVRTAVSAYGVPRGAYVAGRILTSAGLSACGLRHPWVKPRANPASPRPLDEFKLFAVVGTWMEADVVEATVMNAFAQGCDRVLLVDNDSPDETVATAVRAGAELAHSFSTGGYDEELRIRLMNETVEQVSLADGSEHIWWLWLDADEFPHGPSGLTIRDYLATLDRSFRIVGARFINHYPGEEPYYVPGFHPLDFQPLCEELHSYMCWSFHRKHPLQRFDRNGPAIESDIGMHRGFSAERPLLEPTQPIFDHHFPFRDREVSLQRLKKLFSKTGNSGSRADPDHVASNHMLARLRSFEAVYEHDWRAVGMAITPDCRRPQLEPLPWDELVEPEHVPAKRWYAPRAGESSDRLDVAAREALQRVC